jgi:hypothetical protein
LQNQTGVTSIPTFTTTNTGSTPIVATVTVTPKANGCTGNGVSYTITVTPNNTVSAPSINTQTVCIRTPITIVTHTTTGATGVVTTATGLPAGVTAAWSAGTITISGIPTVSGTFNYSITLSGGCSVVKATGTIIVTPLAVAGTLTAPVSVCYGTNVQLSLTGYTGSSIEWFSTPTPAIVPPATTPNFTGVDWGDAIGTGASITDINVTTAMSYKAVVTSGNCGFKETLPKSVKIDATPNGGTVSGGSPLCTGGAATVSVTTGTTVGTYRWQYSVDSGTWTDVPVGTGTAATSAAGYFTSNSATKTAATYLFTNFNLQGASSIAFRVFAINNTCTTGVGSITPTVFTNGTAVGGTVAIAATDTTVLPVCSIAPNLTVTGSTGTIRWERAATATAVTWTNIPAAAGSTTLTSAQILALTATTSNFFRVVTNLGTSGCSATSNVFRVTLAPTAVAGTLVPSSTAVICNSGGTNPGTRDFTVTGATGNWFILQSSSTATFPTSPTIVAQNATGAFTGVIISSTTYYRVVVQSRSGNNVSCNTVTTATVTITVSTPISGSISSTTGTEVSPICNGATVGLTLTGQSTGTISWQSSLDGISGWTTVTGTTATLTTPALTQNTYFRATVTATTPTGCSATSLPYLVYVKQSVTGSVSGNNQLCATNTGTQLTTTGTATGSTYLWQSTSVTVAANGSQTVGTVWITAVGTGGTTATYTTATTSLAATTAYRVVVTSGGCTGNSAPYIVTVLKTGTVSGGTTGTATQCSSQSRTLTLSGGFQGTSLQWQSVVQTAAPTTATVWADIPSATGITLTLTGGSGTTWYRVRISHSNTTCTAFFTANVTTTTASSFITWSACKNATAIPTAVVPVASPFEVKAYPNPYTETFNLSLTTSSEDKVGIVVYDMTGRLIERREVRPSDMVEQQIGDRYPSGVYNIVVTQGEEVKTLRVIKR